MAEICLRRLSVTGLPGPDHPLAGGGDERNGPVGVDPAEPMRSLDGKCPAERVGAAVRSGTGSGRGVDWLSWSLSSYLPRRPRPTHLPRIVAPIADGLSITPSKQVAASHGPMVCLPPRGRSAMAKADIAAVPALGAALFIAIGDVIHERSGAGGDRRARRPCRAVHSTVAGPPVVAAAASSPQSESRCRPWRWVSVGAAGAGRCW